MSNAATRPDSLRFHGRSYLSFVPTPEPPIFEWLAKLDEWTSQFAGCFVSKPMVLDLSAVRLSNAAIPHLISELLISELQPPDIRVMGRQRIERSELGPDLPPVLTDSGTTKASEQPQRAPPDEPRPSPEEPVSLLLEKPVRSGQSIISPSGDVTVLGSVPPVLKSLLAARSRFMARYAAAHLPARREIRGHASFAASSKLNTGHRRSLLHCRRHCANLRSEPTQAWLKGDAMLITPLQ